ncbi:MAG: AMP-binding protein [Ruminococcaceae bacterium]|nr:AMP-binding protein [Oscillospiraceae bacterium]
MRKYPLNPVGYYPTFREMIEQLPAGREDKPAISWFTRKGEEHGVTLGQLREDVRNLQALLTARGLAGRHIAILGENSYEWLLVFFACTYCGSVAVCVDIEQSDDTIRQMLDMTDISGMFYSPTVEEICVQYPLPEDNAFLLSGKGASPSVADLIEEGRKIREKSPDAADTAPTPDSVASIVFTSGTTSYAKPVMLSHRAILTNASDALANVAIGEIAFTALPFYHTYGMTCSVLSMLIGKAHLYINGNLKTVMRDIQLAHPHTMLTVPLMLETIHSKMWSTAREKNMEGKLKFLFALQRILFALGLKHCGAPMTRLRESIFGGIRLIICGGAHMNREIMQQFGYMGVQVLQGYGITECAPLVSVNRNRANKLDSVGLISANSEVKIEDGEILVRGKNVMSGYYKLPQLTEEALRDGWFATGDMGYLDKDGFLFITGRKKNLIVFKNGKKLSPEKLEELIREIPLVQDVVVYGAVSGLSTDDVQVATSIYPNREKCEGMMQYEILEVIQNEINRINRSLPLYQQIQMVNIRETEFSKTALQKIKRHMI